MESQSLRSSARPFTLSIGPRRCATSWIHRYLESRGDVCLPKGVKETRYFDRNHKRGAHFYNSHFKFKKRHKIVAEIGTTFFHRPEAPRRVRDHFGSQIRLLCPLRHPIIRAYSEYHHMRRYGQISEDLPQACADNPDILNSSRYAGHIERWADVFRLDAISFLFKEDLDHDQPTFITQLCEALDLSFKDAPAATRPRYNATAQSKHPALARASQKTCDILRQYRFYAPINTAKKLGLKTAIFGREQERPDPIDIPPADLHYLQDHLTGEIQKFETLIGTPLPQWQLEEFALAG